MFSALNAVRGMVTHVLPDTNKLFLPDISCKKSTGVPDEEDSLRGVFGCVVSAFCGREHNRVCHSQSVKRRTAETDWLF